MTGRIIAKRSTILKTHPIDSSGPNLPPDFATIPIEEGETIEYNWIRDEAGHWLFEATKPFKGRFNWFAFPGHFDRSKPPEPSIVTALFTMPLARSRQLIRGSITFSRAGKPELSIVASSGAPGFQYRGAEGIRGKGMIPPDTIWKIVTEGYHLPTKGIEGWFFAILPSPYTKGNITRSELGLHRDANAPGSAGCIVVLDSTEFNRRVVPYLRDLDQKEIPLEVRY